MTPTAAAVNFCDWSNWPRGWTTGALRANHEPVLLPLSAGRENTTMVADSLAVPAARAALVSDEALMQRYASGDAVAFDALYERYRGPLYRYLLRGCGNPDLAGELFQDVWSRLIQNRKRYRVKARFGTYLFRIAHNRMVDHYRRARPPGESPTGLVAAEHHQPEICASRSETADQLLAALAELPFEQREVILLKEERGLSLAEIAVVTNVGRETVKSRLRYALAKLRKALSHD